VNTSTPHQRTLRHVVRRAAVTAVAGTAITGAAFATMSVLVDQLQIEMSYGSTSGSDVGTDGALDAAETWWCTRFGVEPVAEPHWSAVAPAHIVAGCSSVASPSGRGSTGR
jgi:hypothetical protein